MKKLIVWAPIATGLLILTVVAGCSKAPDAKQDVATNTDQPAKVGGDTNSSAGTTSAQTPDNSTTGTTTPPPATGVGSGTTQPTKPAVKTEGATKPAAGASKVSASESGLVGTYKGSMSLPPLKAGDPNAARAQAMVKAMAGKLTLEVKSDKTFTMTVMFPIEGKWERAGDTLLLHAEKIMGQTMEQLKAMAKNQPGAKNIDQMDKPMKFKASADGKTLTSIPQGPNDKGSMVFTKQ